MPTGLSRGGARPKAMVGYQDGALVGVVMIGLPSAVARYYSELMRASAVA
ncbi:hypothetical protein Misp02_68300 [Microtetraspora sp. NBRC 16547]|nr:hypothetical protein Misp02_68300 [Microtetraspora sp. NBRC 16547]